MRNGTVNSQTGKVSVKDLGNEKEESDCRGEKEIGCNPIWTLPVVQDNTEAVHTLLRCCAGLEQRAMDSNSIVFPRVAAVIRNKNLLNQQVDIARRLPRKRNFLFLDQNCHK